MTPVQATSLCKKGRKLLRSGDLTPYDYTLLDCLVWSCRAPNTATCRVAYSRLQTLARMCRASVVKGIAKLVSLGLVVKIKHRIRTFWGPRMVASRQDTNEYVLKPAPDTESTRQTVIEIKKEIRIEEGLNTQAARASLAAIAASRAASLVLGRSRRLA